MSAPVAYTLLGVAACLLLYGLRILTGPPNANIYGVSDTALAIFLSLLSFTIGFVALTDSSLSALRVW
jgi:hypothetical protein